MLTMQQPQGAQHSHWPGGRWTQALAHQLAGGICDLIVLWPWDPGQLSQPEGVSGGVGTRRPLGAR